MFHLSRPHVSMKPEDPNPLLLAHPNQTIVIPEPDGPEPQFTRLGRRLAASHSRTLPPPARRVRRRRPRRGPSSSEAPYHWPGGAHPPPPPPLPKAEEARLHHQQVSLGVVVVGVVYLRICGRVGWPHPVGTNAGLEPSVARGADAALRGREGVGRGGLARFVRASVLLFFFPRS